MGYLVPLRSLLYFYSLIIFYVTNFNTKDDKLKSIIYNMDYGLFFARGIYLFSLSEEIC